MKERRIRRYSDDKCLNEIVEKIKRERDEKRERERERKKILKDLGERIKQCLAFLNKRRKFLLREYFMELV